MRICPILRGDSTIGVLAVLSLAGLAPRAVAQDYSSWFNVDVLTYHNDNARTGLNPFETVLTTKNVNASNFGKLYSVPVDGKVDAQPLYVSNLEFAAGIRHDAVFAATEHDSVYAFNPQNGSVFWHVSLLGAGETPSDPLNCSQVIPEIGITATPVIDRAVGPHGTVYVVAMSKDGSGNYHQRIHALDLTTGAEELGGPVTIQATYPGTGNESVNGVEVFNPRQHEDRAALLLQNGVVYTSWTSHCDIQPYTGWVIGYDERTLHQANVFNFAPNGSEASIWGSGAGPASDWAGNLYFSVANGTFDTTLNSSGFPSQGDYGNAFVKLKPRADRSLAVADYWTMYNTVMESDQDVDLGSGGFLAIPDFFDAQGKIRRLGIGAGKDQTIYVVDRDNMGKFDPASNATVYQQIPNGLAGLEYGTAAWFNGTVYIGAVGDLLRAFKISNGYLARSSTTSTSFAYPGTTPSVSSSLWWNGIVWAFDNGAAPVRGAAANVPAILHAYDAKNLGVELYNSNQAPQGRDQFGPGNKFIVPTVANGRVFIGTTNSVAAFGLLSSSEH